MGSKIVRIVIITTFLLLSPAGFLMAQSSETAGSAVEVKYLTNVPAIQNADTSNLGGFFNDLYTYGIGIAAILAIFLLMFQGIQYMLSETPWGKKNSKDRITMIFIGLALVISPVIVFSVINPDILNFNLNFKGRLDVQGGTLPDLPDQNGSGNLGWAGVSEQQPQAISGNSCSDISNGWFRIAVKYCPNIRNYEICCGFSEAQKQKDEQNNSVTNSYTYIKRVDLGTDTNGNRNYCKKTGKNDFSSENLCVSSLLKTVIEDSNAGVPVSETCDAKDQVNLEKLALDNKLRAESNQRYTEYSKYQSCP